MLPSFRILGFRCFRKLTIERLGRVNLIVGKNNVGKTTLLDALRVHAAQEDAVYELEEMLERRGEIARIRKAASSSQRVVDWLRALHDAEGPGMITLGVGESAHGLVQLKVKSNRVMEPPFIECQVLREEGSSNPESFDPRQPLPPRVPSGRTFPCQYIPASGLSDEEVARLWDRIVLTEHEDTCLQALRIIEPDIQRVALVDVPGANGSVERSPHVSRALRRQPEPLHSLGEGMSRIFHMMLGMVAARGGRLLIDEIENGLHYSIHEELWRFVFQVAGMLDVQVFATTHSWGCIEAFQAAEREHPGEGILIRLERRGDETRAFVFGEDKLAVVAEQGVEVR